MGFERVQIGEGDMSRFKSKRTSVWINAVNGAVLDWSAICYGSLAVTHALARFKSGFDDRQYAVTHVLTGMAIINYVTFAQAKTGCVALLESGIPWAKVTQKNCKRYGKRVAEVLKAVNPDLAA